MRRGQGYSLLVTSTPTVHRVLLDASSDLGAPAATPAARKAHRIYRDRLHAISAAPGAGRQ